MILILYEKRVLAKIKEIYVYWLKIRKCQVQELHFWLFKAQGR